MSPITGVEPPVLLETALEILPLHLAMSCPCSQAVMQGLTNVSMMYLNYPAKVLFKSSRMVPIMCFGVVWQVRQLPESRSRLLCRLSGLFRKI